MAIMLITLPEGGRHYSSEVELTFSMVTQNVSGRMRNVGRRMLAYKLYFEH